jgi:hypothetical protein
MTFLSIIGFIVLCLILLYASGVYFMFFLVGMGTYNIGGAVNSKRKKVLILVLGAFLCFAWYQVFQHSPFSISLKI